MIDSILNSTKKALGLTEDYTAFDPELIMHINAALSKLNGLGIGPSNGFMIEDKQDLWSSLLGDDPRWNSVKSLVFLEVKLVFDPPQTSFHLDAIKEQIKQLEWRINVERENQDWTDPRPVVLDEETQVLDGGAP